MKYLPLIFLFFRLTVFPQQDSINIEFKYPFHADFVSAAGSFNGWNPEGYSFTKTDSGWILNLKLPAGYYYYKFVVDGKWIPDPSNPMKVNDGGTGFNSILKAGEPPLPERKTSSRIFPKDKLPKPVLDDDPEIVELYYAAWKMAWQKIMKGKKENGYVDEFMDEGFNEMIYQWDTCFMAAFGMYAPDVFPVMPSLDNFYNKQREDGYIQRVYNEETGEMASAPTADEPMVNPPLFAWIEFRYYELTGDASRLERVLPHLIKYFSWIENNCRTSAGNGLYYTTHLGSGMDNIPREGVNKAGWIDFSLQQALAAKYIMKIAEVAKDNNVYEEFKNHHKRISELINKFCWSDSSDFYFDLKEDGTLSPTVHIGAYWSLLSSTADKNKAEAIVEYLNDEKHFNRNHRVPALSFSDPHYDSSGHYWLGGVWAPTNYMVIKGLEEYGYHKLADEIAHQHIKKMELIYSNFTPDETSLAYEERYADGYKTIWECYSPEFDEPATRWDDTFYSRQDFAGWSGLGPIAMLIENMIGLKLNGAANTIEWRINRTDKHGIENLLFRKDHISLMCIPDEDDVTINVKSKSPLTLSLIYRERKIDYPVQGGESTFKLRRN